MRHSLPSLFRRITKAWLLVGAALAPLPWLSLHAAEKASAAKSVTRRPNISFLLADDLGYGDIGAFGQKKIRTPNFDQLAKDGMWLTDHDSAHNVCAFIYDNENKKLPGNSMKLSLLLPLLGAIVPAAFSATTSPPAALRPNILIIVADDLGWGDVGWHGSHIKTPGLDKLVRAGVELDQHYVWPMCSPTRAAILSGRYASRFGVTAAQNDLALFPDTVTLAGGLRESGYATAITGKWHLGSKAEWGPNKFGFDHSYGAFAGGTGPYDHRYKKGEFTGNWHRNGELITEEGHVTDLIAREAIRWIEGRDARPFFLYLPFTAPHIPIDEPQRWLDLYPKVEPLTKRHYAANVTHLDDAVGLVIDALERTGKLANTLIVFTSDNGATLIAGGDGEKVELFNLARDPHEEKDLAAQKPARVKSLTALLAKMAAADTVHRSTEYQRPPHENHQLRPALLARSAYPRLVRRPCPRCRA